MDVGSILTLLASYRTHVPFHKNRITTSLSPCGPAIMDAMHWRLHHGTSEFPSGLLGILLLLIGPSLAQIGCAAPPPPPPPGKAQAQSLAGLGDSKEAVLVTSTITLNFPVENYQEFRAVVDSGRIQLTTDPAATDIRVTSTIELRAPTKALGDAYLKEVKPEGTPSGDALSFRVEVPQQWRNVNFANRPGSMSVHLDVTVPESLGVDLTVVHGPLFTTGNLSKAMLKTSNGDITANGIIRGRIQIEAENGKVVATMGDIPSGSVVVKNGSLELKYAGTGQPLDSQLTLSSSNGDITAELMPIGEGNLSIHIGNGNATASIASTSTAGVSLVATNGSVKLTGTPTTMISQSASEVRANLGTPVGSLQINVTNGIIDLTLLD